MKHTCSNMPHASVHPHNFPHSNLTVHRESFLYAYLTDMTSIGHPVALTAMLALVSILSLTESNT